MDRLNMWVSLTMLAASLSLCGCKPKADSQSAPPRQVVVYCSVDQEIAEPILAAFEKHTGIKALARFDTEAAKTVGLVQRIRAEAAAPAADVFWSGEVFHTIRLAREGLLEPWTPEQPDLRDWPAQYRDAQRRWHGLAARGRVIAYSTDRVQADQAPRRLEDLLDPRWKGRFTMATPMFGTTGGDVASWFAQYGPERASEILRGLKANGVRLASGNSTAVRLVATGQADIAFTDTDDVYAAQRNGWAVAMVPLARGDKGALTIPNTVALVKGGPNAQAARALAAFLLSETAERMLAQSDSHNAPMRASVAAEFPQYALPGSLDIDYETIADRLGQAIETGKTILSD